jgi:hypothetical protein
VPPGTRTLEKPFDEQTLTMAVQSALKATHTTESGVVPSI